MSIKTKLATLLSGNILGQAIPLAALPLLARLYTPTQFGEFALLVAICSLLSLASAARYDVAVISAAKEDKQPLAKLALFTIFTTSSVVFLVVAALYFLNLINLINALLIFLGVVGVALFNLSNNLHNDKEHYRAITLNMTARPLSWVIICVLGTLDFNALSQSYGLQAAFVGSYWLVVLLNSQQLIAVFKPNYSGVRLRQLAISYRHFALFNTPHAMLSSANLNTPSFLLSGFGHVAILGAYSQANKILVTPWQLIGNALFKIYYKLAADKHTQSAPILPVFKRFLSLYTVVLIPIFLTGFAISETFFVLLLGEDWRIAGQIGALLLPWIFARAIGGMLAFIPLVLNLQRPALYFEIAYASCMALTLFMGLQTGNVLASLMWFAWVGAGIVMLQILWLLSKVKQHDNALLQMP